MRAPPSAALPQPYGAQTTYRKNGFENRASHVNTKRHNAFIARRSRTVRKELAAIRKMAEPTFKDRLVNMAANAQKFIENNWKNWLVAGCEWSINTMLKETCRSLFTESLPDNYVDDVIKVSFHMYYSEKENTRQLLIGTDPNIPAIENNS